MPSKRILGLWTYQPLQLVGVTFVVFSSNDYIFKRHSFEITFDPTAVFQNSQIFEVPSHSGSLFYLLLRLYWMLSLPVMTVLLILFVVCIIERKVTKAPEVVEAQENRRWNSAFAKLEKISKAIGSNEKRKEATPKKTSKKPPKETVKPKKNPTSETSWFHSITFNREML